MKQKLKVVNILFIVSLLAACTVAAPHPIVTVTTEPASLTSTFTPFLNPTGTPTTTSLPTATSEPAIPPGCKIVDEKGQFFVISDKEFFELRTHNKEIDLALANHYPEWARYTQNVSWDTEPVKISEIVNSASIDEERNVQVNSKVTLVVLGMSLEWNIPKNIDLYSTSEEINLNLSHLTLEWDKPGNESVQARFPRISNSATYALYVFFNYDKEKLKQFCDTYQRLFPMTP
jgi:hypothetical protein